MGRRTVSLHRYVSVHACCQCVCVQLPDASHHSPWLCAPPSPSSVSVRLLSILAPCWYSSSAEERSHWWSSRRRLSLRSTHSLLQPQKRRESGEREYASRTPPLLSAARRMCKERRQKREKDFFPFFSPARILLLTSPLHWLVSVTLSLSHCLSYSLAHCPGGRGGGGG